MKATALLCFLTKIMMRVFIKFFFFHALFSEIYIRLPFTKDSFMSEIFYLSVKICTWRGGEQAFEGIFLLLNGERCRDMQGYTEPSHVPCQCISILGATDNGCGFIQCSRANLVGEIFRICTLHGFGRGRLVQKSFVSLPCCGPWFFFFFFFVDMQSISFLGNVWLFRQNLNFFQLR